MTRPEQKTFERATLRSLLAWLRLVPDHEPIDCEKPDFIIPLSGKTIGLEVTRYRSADLIGSDHTRRQVEQEWLRLKATAKEAPSAEPELRDVNVILEFHGAVPPTRKHQRFIREIATFVGAHRKELGSRDVEFGWAKFSAPQMKEYVRAVYLRIEQYPEWKSNLESGFVATAETSTIPEIVAEKSAKKYCQTDELWLAIQCGVLISETMLPISDDSLQTIRIPDQCCFSQIFLLALLDVYHWKKGEGWQPTSSRDHDG